MKKSLILGSLLSLASPVLQAQEKNSFSQDVYDTLEVRFPGSFAQSGNADTTLDLSEMLGSSRTAKTAKEEKILLTKSALLHKSIDSILSSESRISYDKRFVHQKLHSILMVCFRYEEGRLTFVKPSAKTEKTIYQAMEDIRQNIKDSNGFWVGLLLSKKALRDFVSSNAEEFYQHLVLDNNLQYPVTQDQKKTIHAAKQTRRKKVDVIDYPLEQFQEDLQTIVALYK